MPVEIVRRGAGTKFDSRKLKKTANEILKLLSERRAETGCGFLGRQAAGQSGSLMVRHMKGMKTDCVGNVTRESS
jgi:hypothetical protein